MSFDLDVFLERSKLPAFDEWAEAIRKEGFPLAFPEPVDLTKHTGFLPAVLGDEESGFEFFVSDLDELDGLPEEARALVPAADAVASFSCHEMQECLAAAVAAAVLARLTSGLFLDPQGSGFFQGQEAIAHARAELDAAAKKEAEEVARHGKLSPAKWAEAFEQTLRTGESGLQVEQGLQGTLGGVPAGGRDGAVRVPELR